MPFLADEHLIPFIDNISMPTVSPVSTNKLSGSIRMTLTTVCSDLSRKTSSRSIPGPVLEVGFVPQTNTFVDLILDGGAPCAVPSALTLWSEGKNSRFAAFLFLGPSIILDMVLNIKCDPAGVQ